MLIQQVNIVLLLSTAFYMMPLSKWILGKGVEDVVVGGKEVDEASDLLKLDVVNFLKYIPQNSEDMLAVVRFDSRDIVGTMRLANGSIFTYVVYLTGFVLTLNIILQLIWMGIGRLFNRAI